VPLVHFHGDPSPRPFPWLCQCGEGSTDIADALYASPEMLQKDRFAIFRNIRNQKRPRRFLALSIIQGTSDGAGTVLDIRQSLHIALRQSRPDEDLTK
jgi:hypothetical protein